MTNYTFLDDDTVMDPIYNGSTLAPSQTPRPWQAEGESSSGAVLSNTASGKGIIFVLLLGRSPRTYTLSKAHLLN